MEKNSILVIDDELEIRELLSTVLSEKYSVIGAADGESGIEKAKSLNPSLILLDLKMPKQSGFDVCKSLRSNPKTKETPIIVLTGSSETSNLVQCFDLGADDFVEKPFKLEELRARIDSKIRKNQKNQNILLTFGDIEMDIAAMTVNIAGTVVPFSTLEFNILHFFMKNAGHVISRERLLESIWNNVTVSDRTVDTHIVSLRKKIIRSNCCINTVYGAGYKMCLEKSH